MRIRNTTEIKIVFLITSLALTLLIIFVLAGIGEAEGRTITVDDDGGSDYEKIQDAVEAAEDGDMIRVYEGEYHGHVQIQKSINFIGNSSKNTTIIANDEVSALIISANGCNISGFRLTGYGDNDVIAGISVESRNNWIFENNCTENQNGIYVNEGSHNNTITDNELFNNEKSGILLSKSDNNTLRNNTCSYNEEKGISIIGASNNNTLRNNTCSYNRERGISIIGASNNTIQNTICVYNRGAGIYVYSRANNNTIIDNLFQYNIGNGIIILSSYGNDIVNNTSYMNSGTGIDLRYCDIGIINGNTCINNTYGIHLQGSNWINITENVCSENQYDGLYIKGENNNVTFNSIFQNARYGINNGEISLSLYATNNWWGHKSGPYHPILNPTGKGDNVTDYVIFNPWIGKPRTWYVDDDALDGGNGNIDRPFNRIQDAINAGEDGDTILVFNGTYNENVVVDKSVSLIGNGSEVTTIDGGGEGDVVSITADWVNISGFLVTGKVGDKSNTGIMVESDHNQIFQNNCSNKRYGIYLLDSSYNIVYNNTCSWNNYYHGIYLRYSGNNTLQNNTCSANNDDGIDIRYSDNITLENNTCISNNDDGIYLYRSSNCTIKNNTCSANIIWGINLEISSNCTISNNICSSNNNDGIILSSSSNCTLKNNTCKNNDYGIYLSSSNDCV